MTIKENILQTLKEAGTWVMGYDLEKVRTRYGWIGTCGGRRCRELAAEGKIDHEIRDGYACYKAKSNSIQQGLL